MSQYESQVTGEPQEMYLVLVNHEEQYSLWPSYKPVPLGWKTVGKERTKEECLAYIEEVWTDMRPLSLRKQMAELNK
ncbi:MAG: MbtH family protein [Alphaproteobacteria bacterium 41-28]|nr:MAG: MbtH family protein [Alphaproteobacteria bacterium 41-28]